MVSQAILGIRLGILVQIFPSAKEVEGPGIYQEDPPESLVS